MTRYAYDPHTFRLRRLRTQRCDPPLADDYQPLGSPQDFAYASRPRREHPEHRRARARLRHPDNPDALGLQTTDPPWPPESAQAMRCGASSPMTRCTAWSRPRPRGHRQHRQPASVAESPRHGYNSGNHGTGANQDNAPHLTRRYTENLCLTLP